MAFFNRFWRGNWPKTASVIWKSEGGAVERAGEGNQFATGGTGLLALLVYFYPVTRWDPSRDGSLVVITISIIAVIVIAWSEPLMMARLGLLLVALAVGGVAAQKKVIDKVFSKKPSKSKGKRQIRNCLNANDIWGQLPEDSSAKQM